MSFIPYKVVPSQQVQHLSERLSCFVHLSPYFCVLIFELSQANRVNDTKIDTIASDTAFLVTQSLEAERERIKAEREQVLAWISTSSHREKQSEILKSRHVGTAEWIFGTEQFQRWFSGPTEMLRCYGVRESSLPEASAFTTDQLLEHEHDDVTWLIPFRQYWQKRLKFPKNAWAPTLH